MTGIEVFSLCAWATPKAVEWNARNRRGIIYRGYETVANPERFFPNELKKKVVVPTEESGRGFTWGT